MSWDGNERRQTQRYGVKRLGIQYSSGLFSGFSEKYLVLNISEGGLYFMTKKPIKEGKRLKVRLDTSELAGPISASVAVVWTQKSAEHDAYKIGCRFAGLGGRALARLRELLEKTVLSKIDVTTGIYLREVERL